MSLVTAKYVVTMARRVERVHRKLDTLFDFLSIDAVSLDDNNDDDDEEKERRYNLLKELDGDQYKAPVEDPQ